MDQNVGVGMGDTARSAAAFRTIFTSWINRALAKSSVDFYRSVQSRGVDLGMRFVGYLFLVPEESREAMLKVVEELRRMGVGVDVFEKLDMIVELLEDKVRELLARGERIKFIYTIPTAQNPTGITMTQDRRKYLLEVAERYDLLIVEDDPYSYFLFEPIQVAPIKALDKSDRVIYLSTASKIFAPGFRLGWVVASEEVIKWFYLAKQSLNLNTSNFVQYIFLEGLRRGVVTKNLPRVKELYKRKRDAMFLSSLFQSQ